MTQPEHIEELKQKSVAGFGYLLRRQVIVKIIFLLGNVVLARLLAPSVFGTYAIIAFVMQFFSSFADVGLGAALIQKKNHPTAEELSTTFWAQQILVCLLIGIVFAVAPLVKLLYTALDAEMIWVIRMMALGFLFSSLKTLPLILMERQLDFRRIAWIEIVEQLLFYTAAIVLALLGYKVWSFVLATILREFSGMLIAYARSTWRPSCLFRLASISDMIRFGFPFQGNNFLNFVKEGVTPIFVGLYSGSAGVGFITWARTFAFVPLVFSESFGRVAFPAFSAIQHDRMLLREAVERSVRMMSFVLLPGTLLMVAFAPEITQVFFTEKWVPGIWAFYLYCTTPLMISVMLPMYSAILSMGKSAVLLKMTVLLVLLEWGLGIPFVIQFGFTGIALNQPIITGIYFFIYRRILKTEGITVALLESIRWQFVGALLTVAITRGVAFFLPVNAFTLPMLCFGGMLIFAGLMWLASERMVAELRSYVRTAFL